MAARRSTVRRHVRRTKGGRTVVGAHTRNRTDGGRHDAQYAVFYGDRGAARSTPYSKHDKWSAALRSALVCGRDHRGREIIITRNKRIIWTLERWR